MDGHQRPLSSGCGLCLPSPPTHPFVLACSSLSRPLPAGGQTPQAPVPSLFSCLPQARTPFSPTHLPRLGSHPPPLWGQLLRRLHSTDHPDSMMPTAVSTINLLCVCIILSHTVSCRNHRAVCNSPPKPSSTPHRSCHLRWFFPFAKILIPDFLVTLVPISPMYTNRI